MQLLGYPHLGVVDITMLILTNNDQAKSCTRQCDVHLMVIDDEAHITLTPAN